MATRGKLLEVVKKASDRIAELLLEKFKAKTNANDLQAELGMALMVKFF